ncbi:MAG TPA: DUF1801 domain-containing protein [Candidatus Dormibacteraeota bacterium]|nr:DUF1801 domain-containing protein [Candidatus Dormibacteraeota bacterium]
MARSRGLTPQAANTIELRPGMSGRASDAKTADGDAPVFAYIASLPQPQRGIAERIDARAATIVPGLRRAVKWGMAYYGVDDGWCFTSGAFVGHVKLMFIRGTELDPEPPLTPVGMGKQTRGLELASVEELDDPRIVSWMQQAAARPFAGRKKR